ncbi:MAG: hypothetical protein CL674_16960 [Bdellovibrionaceae bacterium]|nr:hypothetical protein [Pseudobdellovibrionaceae bacterium]
MQQKKKIFKLTFIAIAMLHLLIIILASWNTGLIPDEFQLAKSVQNILDGLTPYQDFNPYKNVFGYYFISSFFSPENGVVYSVISARSTLGLIFVSSFYFFLYSLKELFSQKALILASILFISLNAVQIYSSNFRIDSLTASSLFFIFIAVRYQKDLLSCILIALSFLISQKSAYFILAFGFSYITYEIFLNNNFKIKQFLIRGTLLLCCICLPLFAYYYYYGLFEPESTVSSNLQYSVKMATETTYSVFSLANWKKTLMQAPIFWLALAIGCYGGLRQIKNLQKETQKLFLFSFFLGLFLLTKSTVWIYSFTNFAPALFVLCLFGINYLFSLHSLKNTKLSQILPIVIILATVLQSQNYLRLGEELNQSESYDLSLLEATLQKEDSYIASANYIFTRKNALENWSWLNYDITKASNHWTKQEKDSFLDKIDLNKPKSLLLDSALLGNSPPFLKEYYDKNFMHFWASVYTRTYQFKGSATEFRVAHDGNYRVLLKNPRGQLSINGDSIGKIKRLFKDSVYNAQADTEWKIQLIPELSMSLLEPKKRKPSLYKNYLDEVHMKDYPF